VASSEKEEVLPLEETVVLLREARAEADRALREVLGLNRTTGIDNSQGSPYL